MYLYTNKEYRILGDRGADCTILQWQEKSYFFTELYNIEGFLNVRQVQKGIWGRETFSNASRQEHILIITSLQYSHNADHKH